MNRNDNLVVQIAVAMIIIALLWLTLIRASNQESSVPLPAATTVPIAVKVQQWAVADTVEFKNADEIAKQDIPSIEILPRLVENVNSDSANLVKQYFAAMEAKNFTLACSSVSTDRCRATNPRSVDLFAREYQSFVNGYEYINVKDLGFKSPSGKDVVCVKYSFRYKDDFDPRLVSEIMSFYVDEENGNLKITDRVCEKKYKEWSGNRACPIEPNARYCVGNIK